MEDLLFITLQSTDLLEIVKTESAHTHVTSACHTQLTSDYVWFLPAFVTTTLTSWQLVPFSTPTKAVPHLTRNAVWDCGVITCYVPIITSVDRSIWESSYYEH